MVNCYYYYYYFAIEYRHFMVLIALPSYISQDRNFLEVIFFIFFLSLFAYTVALMYILLFWILYLSCCDVGFRICGVQQEYGEFYQYNLSTRIWTLLMYVTYSFESLDYTDVFKLLFFKLRSCYGMFFYIPYIQSVCPLLKGAHL